MNIIADTNIFLSVVLNEPEKQFIINRTAELMFDKMFYPLTVKMNPENA